MARRPIARRVLLVCSMLLLLALAWGALAGGLRQWSSSHTPGQQVETAAQLMCGILTLLVVLTCFAARRVAGPVRVVWTVSLVTAAGLSSLVWGPPMPLIALLFALVAFLVAWSITWALRTALAA
jgi:hypothetical protein